MKDASELSTREKIIHEFYKLMAAQGYNRTTLRQVADVCGISKGNLGFHFKKKEEIALAIARSTYSRAYAITRKNLPLIDDEMLLFLLHRILLFFIASRREITFQFGAEMFGNDTYMNWYAKVTYHDSYGAFVKQNIHVERPELWEACVFASFGIYGISNRAYAQKKEFVFEHYSRMFLCSIFDQVRFEQGNAYMSEAYRIFNELDKNKLLSELHLGEMALFETDSP